MALIVFISDFQFSFPMSKTLRIPDDLNWYDIVPEPTNKMTYLTFRSSYHQNVSRFFKKTEPSTYLLDETTATIPFYLVLPRYVPYTEIFKKKIDQMLASGVIDWWNTFLTRIERDEKKFVEKVEPQILTVKSLQIGFTTFLISLAMSFVVFLLEKAVEAIKCAFFVSMQSILRNLF